MQRSRQPLLLTALLLALPALVAPAAAAGETEVKKIKVKKLAHECENEDCEHDKRVHRVIVVDKDGEIETLEGGRRAWIGVGDGPELFLERHGKGGFLGVATTELTPELRRHFGVPEESGLLVARVVEGSAAAAAGVQVGDILTAAGGEAVASSRELVRAVGRREPGAVLELEVWRDGAQLALSATLGERPRQRRLARVLHCDEDCPEIAGIADFDCGGEGECEVEIECRDGDCECLVNGEATECESLPGFIAPGG